MEQAKNEKLQSFLDEKIYEYIETKSNKEALKKIAAQVGVSQSGTKMDIILRLKPTGVKLPVSKSDALAALEQDEDFLEEKNDLLETYVEELKKLNIEELDLSLYNTPVRKQRNNNEKQIDPESSSTPPPPLEDMSQQSGTGKRDKGLSTTEIDYLMNIFFS